jgi:hypothetical protein
MTELSHRWECRTDPLEGARDGPGTRGLLFFVHSLSKFTTASENKRKEIEAQYEETTHETIYNDRSAASWRLGGE